MEWGYIKKEEPPVIKKRGKKDRSGRRKIYGNWDNDPPTSIDEESDLDPDWEDKFRGKFG